MDERFVYDGLRFEYTYDFIKEFNSSIKKLDEYDLDIDFKLDALPIRDIILGIKKRLNGEVSKEYFNEWIVFASHFIPIDYYWFGQWMTCYVDSNIKEIRELYHYVIDFDFKLRHKDYIKKQKDRKMKVIYLKQMYQVIDVYRYLVYLVDYKNKEYDIRIIDANDIDYDLNKTYSFLANDEETDDESGYFPYDIEDVYDVFDYYEDKLRDEIEIYTRNKDIVI